MQFNRNELKIRDQCSNIISGTNNDQILTFENRSWKPHLYRTNKESGNNNFFLFNAKLLVLLQGV